MKSLSESELNFADLIWAHEPIASGELVKLCAEKFEWKKSTTYTVLKHVCDYGYFENKNAVVTSLMSKEEYLGNESSRFVDDNFQGSLKNFLTAFTARRKLTKKQIQEIELMIDKFEE